MRSINYVAAVITFVLYASNSSAQQIVRPTETMGEFTANTSVRLIHSWLSYCSERFPDLKNVLESEFSLFKSKHMEAIKPIMERLASNPDFNEPVPDNTRETFNKIGASMLAEVKNVDPNVYCNGVIKKMRSTTIEDLRSSYEESFARYQSFEK
jgi:acyl carrier protein phosphodiesterase